MTMDMVSCFPAPQLVEDTADNNTADDTIEQEDDILECNYDTNDVTYLYQAIEGKAFMAAIDFLESGKPEAQQEVRTWVTRYEESVPNKVRWSQLPLHAALVFKAPLKLIELLVKHYPKAVRCTDDQTMLPLHLAFRYGATDNVLHLLIKEFPEGINAKDHKGRTPLDFANMGDSWKKGEIIKTYLEQKKFNLEQIKKEREVAALEEALHSESKKAENLEKNKKELEESSAQIQAELVKIQEELDDLKKKEEEVTARGDGEDEEELEDGTEGEVEKPTDGKARAKGKKKRSFLRRLFQPNKKA